MTTDARARLYPETRFGGYSRRDGTVAFYTRVNALLTIGGRHAAHHQRIFDIFVDGHVADQVETLKDEADIQIPHPRPFGHRERVGGSTVQPVAARSGCVEQPNDGEEGRAFLLRRL